MPIHRTLNLLQGDRLFEADLPIFVNRAVEAFDLQEHRHDFHELAFVSEGEGIHYIDDTSLPVARGDLFVIPVGTGHVFRPLSINKDRKLVVYNCTFRADLLERIAEHYTLDREILNLFGTGIEPSWVRVRDRDGEFKSLFERLYLEYRLRRPGYAAALQAGLLQLLVALGRTQLEREGPQASEEDGAFGELLDHVRAHCHETFPLAAAATRLGLGERQFQRVFKARTGIPFSEYVQNCRIDRCCLQLRTTNGKIASIAAAAGYHDLKFFGRLFKQKTGFTPRQYRANSHALAKGAHDKTKFPASASTQTGL